jgi:hypothetical protein
LLLAGKGSRPQGTSAAKEASANKDSLRRAAPDSSGRPPAKKQRVALTVGRAIQAAQEQDLAEVSVRDSSRFSINVRFGSLPSYRAFLDWRTKTVVPTTAPETFIDNVRAIHGGSHTPVKQGNRQKTTRNAAHAAQADAGPSEHQVISWAAVRAAFVNGRYYVPKSMQEAQALFDTLDDMFNTMPEQAAPETNSNESDDEDD